MRSADNIAEEIELGGNCTRANGDSAQNGLEDERVGCDERNPRWPPLSPPRQTIVLVAKSKLPVIVTIPAAVRNSFNSAAALTAGFGSFPRMSKDACG